MISRKKYYFAAALVFLTAESNAAKLVFEFDDLGLTSGPTDNYINQGFIFSPDCHIDVGYGPSGKALGFDNQGCGNNGEFPYIGFNQNFIGPSFTPRKGVIFVKSLNNQPFSMLSTLAIFNEFTLTSSNGGSFVRKDIFGSEFPTFEFSGPEWENVSWLMFTANGHATTTFLISKMIQPPQVAHALSYLSWMMCQSTQEIGHGTEQDSVSKGAFYAGVL